MPHPSAAPIPPGAAARRRPLLWLVGVVVMTVATAGAVVLATSGDQPPTAADAAPTTTPAGGGSGSASSTTPAGGGSGVAAAPTAVAFAFGDEDAPLRVVEWLDLRCPFCAAFARTSMRKIERDYVDPGHVRFEIRDISFFGDQSTFAAAAARAAGEQGRYLEFLHAVFDAAPQQGHPDLPLDRLTTLARDAGVPDLERFRERAESTPLLQAVVDGTNAAHGLGVRSVPLFVIGKTTVQGARPWPEIKTVLDRELEAART